MATSYHMVHYRYFEPHTKGKTLEVLCRSALDNKDKGLTLWERVGDHAPVRGLPVKHPLMHRTRTVDYAIIMSGEIDMMLDDTVVHVKAGDVIIQQATNHGWINRGTQPCRVLFVLMDSKQP